MSQQQTQDWSRASSYYKNAFEKLSKPSYLNKTSTDHYAFEILALTASYRKNKVFCEGVNRLFLEHFMDKLPLYHWMELSTTGYWNLVNFSKMWNGILTDDNINKLREFLSSYKDYKLKEANDRFESHYKSKGERLSDADKLEFCQQTIKYSLDKLKFIADYYEIKYHQEITHPELCILLYNFYMTHKKSLPLKPPIPFRVD